MAGQQKTKTGTPPGAVEETISVFYYGYRAGVAGPEKILQRLGFGRPHHRILYVVARQPGIGLSMLVDLLKVSRQALHRPLRELIDQGYVVQRPAPANRRIAELTLTAKGTGLEAKLTSAQYESFAKAFATAGPESERHWKAVMRALAAQVSSEN